MSLLIDAHRRAPHWSDAFDRWRHLLLPPGAPGLLGSRLFALHLADSRAILGQTQECAELLPQVSASLADGNRLVFVRHVTCTVGICAAAGGDWPAAEAHFQASIRIADETPHPIARADSRRWYAWMLLRRRAPGDNQRSRTMLGEAIDGYRAVGMPRHAALAKEMLRTDGHP